MDFDNSPRSRMSRGRYEDLVERHIDNLYRNRNQDSYDIIEEHGYVGVDYREFYSRRHAPAASISDSFTSFRGTRAPMGFCIAKLVRAKNNV